MNSEITQFIRNPECWKNGILPDELMSEGELIAAQERIAIKEVLENE
jgi:hypothetical protein